MKCSIETFKKFYNLVKEKKIRINVAAKACNYKPTPFSRLCRKFETFGDRIFVHGLKGKTSNHKTLTAEQKKFIVEEYIKQNTDEKNPINFNYWRDELNEIYDIKVSYSTVYNSLSAEGIKSPECHKPGRESVKRTSFRRKNFGELLQWDATPYQWFSWAGDTTYYSLHGALDDSRSTFLALYMTENECSYGYLECRRQILLKYGVECENYTDGSPVFHFNPKESKIHDNEDQLLGKEKKIPLWQQIDDYLKIQLHLARSPQAKGKIERAWETVQGRLAHEFQKRGIKTIEEANIFLETEFLDYYRNHFGKNFENISVFRPLSPAVDLKNLLCVKHERTVNKVGTLSFKGLTFKVLGFRDINVKVNLCINDKGLWVNYKNKDYDVEIKSGLHDMSDAPQVLENIIYRYMYSDMHEHAA